MLVKPELKSFCLPLVEVRATAPKEPFQPLSSLSLPGNSDVLSAWKMSPWKALAQQLIQLMSAVNIHFCLVLSKVKCSWRWRRRMTRAGVEGSWVEGRRASTQPITLKLLLMSDCTETRFLISYRLLRTKMNAHMLSHSFLNLFAGFFFEKKCVGVLTSLVWKPV